MTVIICIHYALYYLSVIRQAENRYKILSVKKEKVDSSLSELTLKFSDQSKNTARLQDMLAKTTEEVTLLTQQRRQLEQQQEESDEKLRQAEYSVEHARDALDEAEEKCVLLQCEIEGGLTDSMEYMCLMNILQCVPIVNNSMI